MPVRTLVPKEGGFGGGPISIRERNECPRGCWALTGVDCDISHWLGRRTKHLQGCGNHSLVGEF